MKRYKILCLHRMGAPWNRKQSTVDLEVFMPNYAPFHRYIVHDGSIRPPVYLSEITWDAILLGATFLCKVVSNNEFKKMLKNYAWIKSSSAVKFAFPQDEYNCSSRLDFLFKEWKVNYVYSCHPELKKLLYPEYQASGKVILGYPSYVSRDWVQRWRNPKKHSERTIDVSYRASQGLEKFGSLGKLKSEIGDRFKKATKNYSLALDISTLEKDHIPGEKWYSFLENSKFCLVSPTGSSLLSRDGEIAKKITQYKFKKPNADFTELEKNCFPKEDQKYIFTSISPRNIEAGLAETLQIGTFGSYAGIMKPNKDYILLEEDCSNIEEVISIMKNKKKVSKMIKSFKNKLLKNKEICLENHARDIINKIALKRGKVKSSDQEILFIRYDRLKSFRVYVFWRWYWIVQLLKNMIIVGIKCIAGEKFLYELRNKLDALKDLPSKVYK